MDEGPHVEHEAIPAQCHFGEMATGTDVLVGVGLGLLRVDKMRS